MKKINLKLLMAIVCVIFLFSGIVIAAGEYLNFSQKSEEEVKYVGDISHFKIKNIRQDPFPSNPGESTDIFIKVENTGGELQNPRFDLILKYPFSLDPSSDTTTDIPSIAAGEKLTFRYKIRIDKNALPGDYEVAFSAFGGEKTNYLYYFNIKVDDVTSNFDVALQEVSKNGVVLALSNTGKNIANSITVKVDEQDDFELLGPSSYIIGNLNSGDYTIITTQMAPKENKNSELKLKVKIDYTDTIGNRRTINKEISVIMTQQIMKGFTDLRVFILYGEEGSKNIGNYNIYFYTTILMALIILFLIFYKRKSKRNRQDEE